MDKAIFEGYINVTGTSSKKLFKEELGSFREIIRKGAFADSLQNYRKPYMTLNHDCKRIISYGADLELTEDKVGLKYIAQISDLQVISMAMCGSLLGCSFTFKPMKESLMKDNGWFIRSINEMILLEVSIIEDCALLPCYDSSTIHIKGIPSELQNSVNAYMKKYKHYEDRIRALRVPR